MKILRVYSNNVVLASDEGDAEVVAIGKGLGFGAHVGDTVAETAVEKLFVLKDKQVQNRLGEIIGDLPSVYLEIAGDILKAIQDEAGRPLDEAIYLTLTDHISVSLAREKAGVRCVNPLLPEIRLLYPEEFRLAQLAVPIIRRFLDVTISEDEIGFITLHIVNAYMNHRMVDTMKVTRMIRDILAIIEAAFPEAYRKKGLPYDRLLRHLQLFLWTLVTAETVVQEESYFYTWGKSEHKDAYACVQQIAAYLEEETGKKITNGEQGYLLLHLVNLIHS